MLYCTVLQICSSASIVFFLNFLSFLMMYIPVLMKFVRSISKIVMLPFLDGMYTVHYQIRSRHIDFLALKLKSQASPLSGLPLNEGRET